MNTLHLKYAIEVEKTGSITKAAENLYMNQPHLSKAIKELEENLGITIFNRTSKGVIPTSKGSVFLIYAKNILSQIEEMESLYKKKGENEFNISAPRASYISYAMHKFIKSLCSNNSDIDINYRETNSVRTIKNVSSGEDNMGIVRYQTIYKKYFLNFIKEKSLEYKPLWNFEYFILMSKKHPLSNKKIINSNDLSNYIKISHGDSIIPSLPLSELKQLDLNQKSQKNITIYERASQFEILSEIPLSYMFVSSVPLKILDKFDLTQKKCNISRNQYSDIIVFKKGYKLNKNEDKFISILKNVVNDLEQNN